MTALFANPTDRLQPLVLSHATEEGHAQTRDPDLCFYRFSEPSTFVKGASVGVTLGVVIQGEKRVRVGGDEYVVDPHNLLVLTREVEHISAVFNASRARPYLGLALCFPPERVARALMAVADAGGTQSAEDAPPAFVMPIDADIVDAIARLLRTLRDPLDRKVLAPLVTDELLYRLLRSDAAAAVRRGAGAAADAGRILASMQYIRTNHAKKLDVGALARNAAMSPSHYAHRFAAVARTTPMRYLREVRLEQARSLLFEAGARASDVGTRVGFESAAHFAREFKRRYGTPPSRFARSH